MLLTSSIFQRYLQPGHCTKNVLPFANSCYVRPSCGRKSFADWRRGWDKAEQKKLRDPAELISASKAPVASWLSCFMMANYCGWWIHLWTKSYAHNESLYKSHVQTQSDPNGILPNRSQNKYNIQAHEHQIATVWSDTYLQAIEVFGGIASMH